jgi:hypothetical protein
MSSTQLTSAIGYNTDRMIFSKALKNTIPDSVPQISYKRVNISTKNSDGTVGDLIFETSRLFSFGVSENVNPKTKEVIGYVLPLCLWNRDGETEDEVAWTDTFTNCVDKAKQHLIDNKKTIGMKYNFDASDLKDFNPLYLKRNKETGEPLPDAKPQLYPKLIVSKKNGQEKILTTFYDVNNDYAEMDPMQLMGKLCWVEAAVKIESIFIGSQVISLQVKLWEVAVTVVETGIKRLLRPKMKPQVKAAIIIEEEDEDGYGSQPEFGSLPNSEDEEEESQKKRSLARKRVTK